jgi:hypothetical protein
VLLPLRSTGVLAALFAKAAKDFTLFAVLKSWKIVAHAEADQ